MVKSKGGTYASILGDANSSWFNDPLFATGGIYRGGLVKTVGYGVPPGVGSVVGSPPIGVVKDVQPRQQGKGHVVNVQVHMNQSMMSGRWQPGQLPHQAPIQSFGSLSNLYRAEYVWEHVPSGRHGLRQARFDSDTQFQLFLDKWNAQAPTTWRYWREADWHAQKKSKQLHKRQKSHMSKFNVSDRTLGRILKAWNFTGDVNKLTYQQFEFMQKYANTKFYVVRVNPLTKVYDVVFTYRKNRITYAQFDADRNAHPTSRGLDAKVVYRTDKSNTFWFDRHASDLPRDLIGVMYDVAEGKCTLNLLDKKEIVTW